MAWQQATWVVPRKSVLRFSQGVFILIMRARLFLIKKILELAFHDKMHLAAIILLVVALATFIYTRRKDK
ncbi:hypothetical protein [Oenococcus oeni]